MTKAVDEELSEITSLIARALRRVYRRDAYLLEHALGERTLVGRLHRELAPAVERLGTGLSADVEYNRNTPGRDVGGILYKYLNGLPDAPEAHKTPRYPDLIIHRRGESGPKANVLVLEAKRAEVGTGNLPDHAKLVAWCQQFEYRAGVRLEFHRDLPHWAWVDSACLPHELVLATPVRGF